jgi:hypothetical protein
MVGGSSASPHDAVNPIALRAGLRLSVRRISSSSQWLRAISLFGFNSGAALATVVGVLIEVPVMLLVAKVVNSTRCWYEAGSSRGPIAPR